MTSTFARARLHMVRLQLAHGEAEATDQHGYDLFLPLDQDGRVVPHAFAAQPVAGRVRCYRPGAADTIGRLAFRNGDWIVDCQPAAQSSEDPTPGACAARIVPGERVTIWEVGGHSAEFQVAEVQPV